MLFFYIGLYHRSRYQVCRRKSETRTTVPDQQRSELGTSANGILARQRNARLGRVSCIKAVCCGQAQFKLCIGFIGIGTS